MKLDLGTKLDKLLGLKKSERLNGGIGLANAFSMPHISSKNNILLAPSGALIAIPTYY